MMSSSGLMSLVATKNLPLSSLCSILNNWHVSLASISLLWSLSLISDVLLIYQDRNSKGSGRYCLHCVSCAFHLQPPVSDSAAESSDIWVIYNAPGEDNDWEAASEDTDCINDRDSKKGQFLVPPNWDPKIYEVTVYCGIIFLCTIAYCTKHSSKCNVNTRYTALEIVLRPWLWVSLCC